MTTFAGSFMTSLFADLVPGLGTYPEPPDIVPLRILGLAERPASQEAVRSAFRARLSLVPRTLLPTRWRPSFRTRPTRSRWAGPR